MEIIVNNVHSKIYTYIVTNVYLRKINHRLECLGINLYEHNSLYSSTDLRETQKCQQPVIKLN